MDQARADDPDDDPSRVDAGDHGGGSPYRRRWLGYGLLALAFFLVSLHRTSTAVLSEGLLDAFGLTATGLGLLHSSFFYLYAALQVPAGLLTDRYGARGRSRYVPMEAGHAAENVYLQAEALDLSTVVVGAFRDDDVRSLLDLSDEHRPLYVIPVGHRP